MGKRHREQWEWINHELMQLFHPPVSEILYISAEGMMLPRRKSNKKCFVQFSRSY